MAEFTVRFHIRKEYRDLVLEVHKLSAQIDVLNSNDSRPSEIVRALDESSEEARLVLRVACDDWLVRQRLDLYQRRLRHVRSVLDGDDLRRMGVEPGRIYRQILERLRDARLDGEITTRARRGVGARGTRRDERLKHDNCHQQGFRAAPRICQRWRSRRTMVQWRRRSSRSMLSDNGLKGLLAVTAGVGVAALLYPRCIEPQRIGLDRYVIPIGKPGLPPAGLTILHLSDLHCRAGGAVQAAKLARLRRLLDGETYDLSR